MRLILLTILLIFTCAIPSTAMAWRDFGKILTIATDDTKYFSHIKTVKVKYLIDALKAVYGKEYTTAKFKADQGFNPNCLFAFRDRLTNPEPMDVILTYIDEPLTGDMDDKLKIKSEQEWIIDHHGFSHSKIYRQRFIPAFSINSANIFDFWNQFHYPLHDLGEAPVRARELYKLAKKFLIAKEYYWGFRFLSWSLFYLLNMTDPFNVSEFVTLKFASWTSVFKGWSIFLGDTYGIVSNYHLAMEDYADFVLGQEILNNHTGPLHTALKSGDPVVFTDMFKMSRDTALKTAKIASRFGRGLKRFFPESLSERGVDYLNDKQNYSMTAIDVGNAKQRKEVMHLIGRQFTEISVLARTVLTEMFNTINQQDIPPPDVIYRK